MTPKNENRVTAPAARKALPVRPDVQKTVDVATMQRFIARAEAAHQGLRVEDRILDRGLPTCRRYQPVVGYAPDTREWRWAVWRFPVGTDAMAGAYKMMVAAGSSKNEEVSRVSSRYAAERIYEKATRPQPVKIAPKKKTGIDWVSA